MKLAKIKFPNHSLDPSGQLHKSLGILAQPCMFVESQLVPHLGCETFFLCYNSLVFVLEKHDYQRYDLVRLDGRIIGTNRHVIFDPASLFFSWVYQTEIEVL